MKNLHLPTGAPSRSNSSRFRSSLSRLSGRWPTLLAASFYLALLVIMDATR